MPKILFRLGKLPIVPVSLPPSAARKQPR